MSFVNLTPHAIVLREDEPTTDTETYYTTAEAARALGMRTSQVSRACAVGTIRGVLKDVPNPRCGFTYRIPAASLEEYRAMREAHRVYDAARRTVRGEG